MNEGVDLDKLAEGFDVHDEQLTGPYYEVLDRMLDQGPVHRVETQGGYWLFVGYDAVSTAVLDPDTFSSAQGTILGDPDRQKFKPNECDLPELRPWRSLMAPFFTRKATESFVVGLDAVANKMIDEFDGTGKADLVQQYAKPFVLYSIFTVLLGFDAEQTAVCVDGIDKALYGADEPIREQGWGIVAKFCYDLLEVRKDEPSDEGLVDVIRTGIIDGQPISRDEFVGWALQMIAGGASTTPLSLGNLFVHLTDFPDVRRRAAIDPAFLDIVIQESLRFETTPTGIARTVTKEVAVGGCPMQAGDKVLLSWAAANRDEAFTPNARTFDPDRGMTRQLAFGTGVHRCVGERFALAVTAIATRELLARIPDFRIDSSGVVDYKLGMSRGPLHLPVVFP